MVKTEENKNMADDRISLEDMPASTEVTRIKKKIAPLIVISVAAATILCAGYGILHYRISQTDAKIDRVLSEVATKSVDEAKLEEVVSRVLSPITKRLDNVEQKVIVLEEKTADLDLAELKALKKELEEKIKVIEKNQALLERIIKNQENGASAIATTPTNTNSGLTAEQRMALANSGAPMPAQPQNTANNYVIANGGMPVAGPAPMAQSAAGVAILDGTDILPFKLVDIIDEATASVKINDKIYSLDIRTSLIQNRYDFIRLDPSKRMAIVKDGQTNQYYTIRVTQ